MFVSCNLALGQGLLRLSKLLRTSAEYRLMCIDYCDWGTRDSNGVAKVSVLSWRYAVLRTVITFDVGVHVDLDRHSRSRGGAAQGHQP
jgi:hypothetical protein